MIRHRGAVLARDEKAPQLFLRTSGIDENLEDMTDAELAQCRLFDSFEARL